MRQDMLSYPIETNHNGSVDVSVDFDGVMCSVFFVESILANSQLQPAGRSSVNLFILSLIRLILP